MFAKAWLAILMGLLLGSVLFLSGCGWFGNGYCNNPYYGQPPACGPVPANTVPAGGAPVTGGWRAVPSSTTAPPAGTTP